MHTRYLQKIGLFVLLGLFHSACTTTMMLTSKVKSNQINSLLDLGSFAYVATIEDKSQYVYYTDTCRKAAVNVNQELRKIIPQRIRIDSLKKTASDSVKLTNVCSRLVKVIENRSSIKNIKITTYLDSLLLANGQDFAIFSFHTGHVMTEAAFKRQRNTNIVASVAVSHLLFPTVYTVNHSSSTLICCIIDRKNQNIAFYRKNVWDLWIPTRRTCTDQQLRDIFGNYFNRK